MAKNIKHSPKYELALCTGIDPRSKYIKYFRKFRLYKFTIMDLPRPLLFRYKIFLTDKMQNKHSFPILQSINLTKIQFEEFFIHIK
jgi:hypothetical protein